MAGAGSVLVANSTDEGRDSPSNQSDHDFEEEEGGGQHQHMA